MTTMRTEKEATAAAMIEIDEGWGGLLAGRYLLRETLFASNAGIVASLIEALESGKAVFSPSAAELAEAFGAAPSVRLWPPPFGRRLTLTPEQLQQIVDEAVMRHDAVMRAHKPAEEHR